MLRSRLVIVLLLLSISWLLVLSVGLLRDLFIYDLWRFHFLNWLVLFRLLEQWNFLFFLNDDRISDCEHLPWCQVRYRLADLGCWLTNLVGSRQTSISYLWLSYRLLLLVQHNFLLLHSYQLWLVFLLLLCQCIFESGWRTLLNLAARLCKGPLHLHAILLLVISLSLMVDWGLKLETRSALPISFNILRHRHLKHLVVNDINRFLRLLVKCFLLTVKVVNVQVGFVHRWLYRVVGLTLTLTVASAYFFELFLRVICLVLLPTLE